MFCDKLKVTHWLLMKFCKDIETNPKPILKYIKLTKSLRNSFFEKSSLKNRNIENIRTSMVTSREKETRPIEIDDKMPNDTFRKTDARQQVI